MLNVAKFEQYIKGEYFYEIDNSLFGFNCIDFNEFMDRLMKVNSSIEDYSELLRDVYPYYFSKSLACYVDAPYLITNMFSYKGKSKEQYYDDIVRMCSIAGVCYRLAKEMNNRGKLLYDNKAVSRAFIFTSAAMLNKFADSVVDVLNSLYVSFGTELFNEFKDYFLTIKNSMLESKKDYMVPYLDSFFIKNKPLIMKSYYKPMYKYKKVAMFDVYKERQEKARVDEFLNKLYTRLSACINTGQPTK
jgi:hypothetical protein